MVTLTLLFALWYSAGIFAVWSQAGIGRGIRFSTAASGVCAIVLLLVAIRMYRADRSCRYRVAARRRYLDVARSAILRVGVSVTHATLLAMAYQCAVVRRVRVPCANARAGTRAGHALLRQSRRHRRRLLHRRRSW